MHYWKISAKDKFWPIFGRIVLGAFVIACASLLVTAIAIPFTQGGLWFGLAFWASVGGFVGLSYLVGSYVVRRIR